MIEITLGDGRVLGIEPVTPAESMRLAEGTRALSGNRGWCSMALVAASIRSIDGIPRPYPTHKKHVEALLKDLDEDAVAAIRAVLSNAKAAADATAPEIEFRKLSPYELLKIYELAAEFNDVRGWIGPATIAASVRKIDDKAVVFPENQADLSALVAELGMAGIAAATFKMNEALDAADARAKGLETAAKKLSSRALFQDAVLIVMNGAASGLEAALAMSDVWRSATVLAIREIEARRRGEMTASIVAALRGN